VSKHTPGPWRAWHDSYGRFQIMAGGLPLSPSREGAQPGEGEANAALIASAPDLLAACEEAAWAIESYCEDHAGERPTDVTVVLPALLSAIAKAGGAK